jgi:two-component system chemotaxis response regulator CheB
MIQQPIIHILILDDSASFREIVEKAVQGDRGLSVLPGRIGGSVEKRVRETSPDVIVLNELFDCGAGSLDALLDLLNPSTVTSFAPCVVIGPGSSETMRVVGEHDAEFIRLSGQAGAAQSASFRNEICTKLKLAGVAAASMRLAAGNSAVAKANISQAARMAGRDFRYHVIAIGASTGGTEATATILENLPAEMPGIVITQHMPADFTRMYAERLNRISKLSISEARDGERVEPGTALVAPGGLQMWLKKDTRGYYVRCAAGEKVNGHSPSVGVLFDSAAQCAGKDAIGVLLTGMGRDGAYELLHMREAGAFTIGQDQESCVVYGMPKVAYEIGAVMQQLPIDRIAEVLIRRSS